MGEGASRGFPRSWNRAILARGHPLRDEVDVEPFGSRGGGLVLVGGHEAEVGRCTSFRSDLQGRSELNRVVRAEPVPENETVSLVRDVLRELNHSVLFPSVPPIALPEGAFLFLRQ